MYTRLHVNCPVFLSDFNETHFLDRFSKNIQFSNFMKICPVGSLVITDGRTHGHDEANSRFSQLYESAPKKLANESFCLQPDSNSVSVNQCSIL